MLHVLLDGDNIHIETFMNHVKESIDNRFGTLYIPQVFCQSNVILKYRERRNINLTVLCCNTKNKNASDARILFHAGKLSVNPENTVVIVSNDKIFEEVADDKRIILIKHVPESKRLKLKKTNVLQVFKELYDERTHESDDIYVSDIQEYFPNYNVVAMHRYISEQVKDLVISCNDVVYFNTESISSQTQKVCYNTVLQTFLDLKRSRVCCETLLPC
jgi:hypothetical protein